MRQEYNELMKATTNKFAMPWPLPTISELSNQQAKEKEQASPYGYIIDK